jgi:hypothetical protein
LVIITKSTWYQLIGTYMKQSVEYSRQERVHTPQIFPWKGQLTLFFESLIDLSSNLQVKHFGMNCQYKLREDLTELWSLKQG